MVIQDQFWGPIEEVPLTLSEEEEAMFIAFHGIERYAQISRGLGGKVIGRYHDRERNKTPKTEKELSGELDYYLMYLSGLPAVILKMLKRFSPKYYTKATKGLLKVINEK